MSGIKKKITPAQRLTAGGLTGLCTALLLSGGSISLTIDGGHLSVVQQATRGVIDK
jgi:hypothetical protein